MSCGAFTPSSPLGIKWLKHGLANFVLFLRVLLLAIGITSVTQGFAAWSYNLFRASNASAFMTIYIVASVALVLTGLLFVHSIPHRIRLLRNPSTVLKSRRCTKHLSLRTAVEVTHAAAWTAAGILYILIPGPVFPSGDASHYAWESGWISMNFWNAYFQGATMAWVMWGLSYATVPFVVWEEIWAQKVRRAMASAALEEAKIEEAKATYGTLPAQVQVQRTPVFEDAESSTRPTSESLPGYEEPEEGWVTVDKKW